MREILEELEIVWEELPSLLTRIVSALAIFVVGVFLVKIGKKLLRRAFDRYEQKHKGNPQGRTLRSLAISVFKTLMYFAIGLTCLSTLGVNVASLLTVAGFSGVAIAFGCQTLVKDLVSGMFIWFDGSCNVGNIVTVAGQTGIIENVGLRTTTLRATNGSLFVIPNGEIRTVINMTPDYRCAVVDITVSHGQDYTRALEVLREAMSHVNEKYDFISEDPQVNGYTSMDGRAATVRIECRCTVNKCWELERGIRLYALEAFRKEGIKP